MNRDSREPFLPRCNFSKSPETLPNACGANCEGISLFPFLWLFFIIFFFFRLNLSSQLFHFVWFIVMNLHLQYACLDFFLQRTTHSMRWNIAAPCVTYEVNSCMVWCFRKQRARVPCEFIWKLSVRTLDGFQGSWHLSFQLYNAKNLWNIYRKEF